MRVKVEHDMYTPLSNSPKLTAHEVDTHLPMEIVVDKLMKVARLGQKRGWHRDELGLSDGKHLNHTEKNQLLVEVLLLEQFIAGLGPSCQGDNGFLGDSGLIHIGICKDFDETVTELCHKDDKVLKAP